MRVLTKAGRRITLISGCQAKADAEFLEQSIEDFFGVTDREVKFTWLERYRGTDNWVRIGLGFAFIAMMLGIPFTLIRSSSDDRRILQKDSRKAAFGSRNSLHLREESEWPQGVGHRPRH